MIRADAGGHSAPVDLLHQIYDASLWNLGDILREFDRVEVYDNSRFNQPPLLVLVSTKGEIDFLEQPRRTWLEIPF